MSQSTRDDHFHTFSSSHSKHNRVVVTVPSWARNLAPEFPSDDEDENLSSPSQSASRDRRRTISSSFPRRNETNSEASTSSSPSPSSQSEQAAAAFAGSKNAHKAPPQDEQDHSISTSTGLGGTTLSDDHAGHHHHGGSGHAGDRWWTFTLPSKYLAKVQDYAKNAGFMMEDHGGDDEGDRTEGEEERKPGDRSSRRKNPRIVEDKSNATDADGEKSNAGVGMTMATHLHPPNIFSTNQSLTPNWSSPWTPFRRETSHPSFHFGQDLPLPTTTPKTSPFESFILHNPFVPLLFRFFNLALNTCTLAIASHIRMQEKKADVIGIVGSSTLFAIIVTPFAMIHIFGNLYIEYFGRPIGLWAVRKKMFHTLTELIFICLYSSILSLSFDDLFTSSLECTTYTPYARWNVRPPAVGDSQIEGTLADSICSQQIALVVFVFSSVGLYIAVLVVSLLRIFAKVSRK